MKNAQRVMLELTRCAVFRYGMALSMRRSSGWQQQVSIIIETLSIKELSYGRN